MTHELTRRIRDPLYGLIRFDGEDPVDVAAWELINTRAFQRLRRIKQLGFSEFVFPGATHTRFAHSIGVFHTARKLIGIINREIPTEKDEYRAKVAMLSALLHDIGHGPFSHAFELAQKARGFKKKHEQWSADIILSEDSGIPSILKKINENLPQDIADLLTNETPHDIYHAVVSSSFDADRLDYLRRDKMMSGSGAGSIDFDWLFDNVRVAKLNLIANDEDESSEQVTPTFALGPKALQAAEAFLIARYHLYDQVYLHKTTRGFEIYLRECLKSVAETVKAEKWDEIGLSGENPLITFLSKEEPSVEEYMALDDFVIWGTLSQLCISGKGAASDFAKRIINREVMPSLDIESVKISHGLDPVVVNGRMNSFVKGKLDKSIFRDQTQLSCYGQIGADEVKLHKRITIDSGDEHYREIIQLSRVIEELAKPKTVMRYYFLDKDEKIAALDSIKKG